MDKSYLTYPNRKHGQDHDLYDWRMAKDRPKLSWDNGAKVAINFIIPLEFFPLNPSGVPFKHPGAMVTPYPDLRHFTVRDYGNRVGVHRILFALDYFDLKATFAVNGEIAKRYPPLIDTIIAHGHEIIPHGLSTNHLHHEGLSIDEEKNLFLETKCELRSLVRLRSEIPSNRKIHLSGNKKHLPSIGDIGEVDQAYTEDGRNKNMTYFYSKDGRSEYQIDLYDDEIELASKQQGWMSPARNQSSRTLELLAAEGFNYCLDWEMDQVPVTATTENGDITLIPNNYELSDFTLLHTRRQTEEAWLSQMKASIDLLLEEHERFGCQMLGLTLTPYIMGQPFRIWALLELLAHIKDMADVSVFTAGEIATQFATQR